MKAPSPLSLPSGDLRAFCAASTGSWSKIRRLVRKLSDAELEQASQMERLGRRRMNTLRVLHAEQQQRSGQARKMQKLEMEKA